jgi:zeaxanthin glucosyltransferase
VSRFLFVVPPLRGHINPAAAVSAALVDRGHEIAWVGPESVLRPALGPRMTLFPTGVRMYRELRDGDADVVRAFLGGYVIPLARFVLAAVDAATERFRPDVLVVDQHAFAGALVARRRGLRWASLVPTSTGLNHASAVDPGLDEWARGPLAKLWAQADLPPGRLADLLFSPALQVGFTTRALLGPMALPDQAVLVGPALAERRDDPPFPYEWLDPDREHVLVTVGTLNTDIADDFYARMVWAVSDLGHRLQAIVVAAPDGLPPGPGHVLVAAQVPVLRLLPELAAVVCHGGMNTVGEALAHGIPLVLAPITLDQPTTADQVSRAGAGLRVDFAGAGADDLRAALLAVLDEPAYRVAAGVVRESFAAAGGAAAAADHLVRLAHH